MRTFVLFLIAILCPICMWGQFNPENPEEPSLDKPTAEFGYSVYNNRVKFQINTLNASRYEWSFGDGTTSNEKNPLHVYPSSGDYTVTLTVSNGVGADTCENIVHIDPEDTWYLADKITLDPESSDIYNYTSLNELLLDLFNLRFDSGRQTVILVKGASFELSPAIDLTVWKDKLLQKMEDSKFSMWIVGNDGYKTLKLWQACSKEDFNALMEMREYMSFSNIYVSLGPVRVNVSGMDSYFRRTVCSGNAVSIYFSSISSSFSYAWKLKEASSAITGGIESGEGTISGMTLVNTSEKTEELVYEVSFMRNGEVYYTKDCRISVYPEFQGLNLISPSENEVVASPSRIHFEWDAVPGATSYSIYYREYSENEEMGFEYLEGTSGTSIDYSGSGFQFDKSYEWYVSVYTQCGTFKSEVSKFRISQAPDLRVSSLETDVETVKPGQVFTISAIVTNKGTKAVSGLSWSDQLWEIGRNNEWTLVSTKPQQNKDLGIDESYVVEFEVTAPLDDLKQLRYQLRLDHLNQMKEGDESNNYKDLSIPITVVTIPEDEYDALKSLYASAKGESWRLTHTWDTTKNTVSRLNWENVLFDNDGHVLSIDLPGKNLSGTIPGSLFTMPYLQKLDLSGNSLSGRLESVITRVASAKELKELDLSHNKLEGMIPMAINLLEGLTSLDLSYNKIQSMEGVLSSEKLTSLDITNQEISIKPIRLERNPLLELPSICLYDHLKRELGVYPDFRISSKDVSFELRYVEDRYFIYNGTDHIRIPSGEKLTITQINGSAEGSCSSFEVLFEHGDADMDDKVTLLDAQQTLNYIICELEQNGYVVFNHDAANTYADTLVNVQDMVATINLIMETDFVMASDLRSSEATAISLSVADGYLVLDNPFDQVTGMDVILEGVSSEQVEFLLSKEDYIYATRDMENGVRLVLLNMTGKCVPLGKTKVMKVNGAEAAITCAMLSNKEAKAVPVWFDDKGGTDHPTGIDRVDEIVLGDPLRILIPEGAKEIRLGLYQMSGRMVWSKRLSGMVSDTYSVHEDLAGLPSGTYILRSEICMDQDVIVRNIKIFISK